MKRQVFRSRRRQAPPLIPLLALILTVAAVLTAPLAMSKYVATGAGAAGARIAAWDPKWIPWETSTAVGNGGAGARDAGYVFHPSGAVWTTARTVYWRLDNSNTEVGVTAALVPKITQSMTMNTGYNSLDGASYALNRASNTHVGTYFPVNASFTASLSPLWQNFTQAVFRENVSAYATGEVTWGSTNSTANGRTAFDWVSTTMNVAPGSGLTFSFSFRPYNAAPAPTNYNAGNNRIEYTTSNASNHTMSNLYSTYWRTYRINAAGYAVQVD